MAEVTRLESVDLRDVWPNEASDFTPWLAENMDALGEALGLEVELEETEAAVGSFSLDIRARDVSDNRAVVIENQLEPTNHDHLGKMLTYAAGYDAGVVVWVAREFRDEHRAALDWLNQRTGLETEFYGVVVRAVRIGASLPAAVFDVVARPNEFRKRHVNTNNVQNNKDADAYRQFWERITERLKKDGLNRLRHGYQDKSLRVDFGVPGIWLSLNFRSRNRVAVQFYMGGSKDRNKKLFDHLNRQRERIESAFGEQLRWDRFDNSKRSRIIIYRKGSISDSGETLDEVAEWMVNRVVKLHQKAVSFVREAAEAVDGEMTEESDFESLDDEADEDEE